MTTLGYYRYSDIMWEWLKYEDNVHEQALKSLFNPSGLTDPGCPLRFPGADGIELYIGEFHNHHKVLLFSSHQIEYARYYLETTNVVRPNESVKLPSWEFLHPLETFTGPPTPCLFSAPEELKQCIRQLDKHKRQVKQGKVGGNFDVRTSSNGKLAPAPSSSSAGRRSGPAPSSPKQPTIVSKAQSALEKSREAWAVMEGQGQGAFLAIDFETYEVQQKIVLEWGWSGTRFERKQGQNGTVEKNGCGHFLARDYLLSHANGKYVPDNRKKYRFGTTEVPELDEFQNKLRLLIEEWRGYAAKSGGPLYLVFHDTSGDLKTFSNVGLGDLAIHNYLPATSNFGLPGELYTVDTKQLYDAVVAGSKSDERSRSLETMCNHLGLKGATSFHNAGNDAHYTLDCLKLMMVPDVKLMWMSENDFHDPDSDEEPAMY